MREKRALHTREELALAGEVHTLARGHGESDRSNGDVSRSLCDVICTVQLTLDWMTRATRF
jgi:hypothetical protein